MEKGFNLIEFLIYSAIVAIFVGGLVLISINVMQGRVFSVAGIEVSQNARFALNKIDYLIYNSEGIVSPGKGMSSDELVLDYTENIKIKLLDGSIVIDGGESITYEDVIVSDLDFINISRGENERLIRIKMTIEYKNPADRREFDFKESFIATKGGIIYQEE